MSAPSTHLCSPALQACLRSTLARHRRYDDELLLYLHTRNVADAKAARRLRLVRRSLRRTLGVSTGLSRMLQLCVLFSLLLAAACVWLFFEARTLQAELDSRKSIPAAEETTAWNPELKLNRHIIALTASGASNVCRCFDTPVLTDRHRLRSVRPIIDVSQLQVRSPMSGLFAGAVHAEVQSRCLGAQVYQSLHYHDISR